MSKFNEELIDSYAKKLLIGLTREENEQVLREFDLIDEHIDKLNDIEGLDSVVPMTHCLDDFEFSLREDVADKSVEIDDLLANSDQVVDRKVKVPKVVG